MNSGPPRRGGRDWGGRGSGRRRLGGRGYRVWALPHHSTFCPRMTQCYNTSKSNSKIGGKKYTQNPSLTNAWISKKKKCWSLCSRPFMTELPCVHGCPDSCLSSLSVLISLPASIRSLTTDHVIIQLTQHQISSGVVLDSYRYTSLSLSFLLSSSMGWKYYQCLFSKEIYCFFSSFSFRVKFKNKYTHVARQGMEWMKKSRVFWLLGVYN
jgi:hypothetical protein